MSQEKFDDKIEEKVEVNAEENLEGETETKDIQANEPRVLRQNYCFIYRIKKIKPT